MRRVMVRYRVRPDQAAANEELVRAVYDELERTTPAGLRYATFQLELHTGDLPGACAFYAQLLCWLPERIDAGRGSTPRPSGASGCRMRWSTPSPPPPGQPSIVYVVFGGAGFANLDLGSPGTRAVRIVRGDAAFGIAGSDGAGDVNGDGFDDVFVASPAGTRGRSFVVFGSAAPSDVDLAAPPAERTMRILGRANEDTGVVAGAGDLDAEPRRRRLGDGAAGRAPLLRSATRTTTPGADVLRLVGPFERDAIGDLGRAGDTDGDGRADVVVAGPSSMLKSRADSGGAWLYGYGRARPCAVVPRPGGRPVMPSPGIGAGALAP